MERLAREGGVEELLFLFTGPGLEFMKRSQERVFTVLTHWKIYLLRQSVWIP